MKSINLGYLFFLVFFISFLNPACKKRPPGPNLISLSPEQGSVGTEITIEGENLFYFEKAFFGDTEAEPEPETSNNGERMKLLVPANLDTGSVEVYLTYEDGRSNSLEFKVVSGMTSEGIPIINLPMPSIVISGCEFEIQGENLNTITEVIFPVGLQAEILTQSATQLIVQVPQDATTGTMTFYASTDTILWDIQVNLGELPVIDRILPASNDQGGPVLVYGQNLDLVEEILFGDIKVSYSDINFNSTLLQFHVPVSDSIKGQLVPLRFKTDQGCFTQAIDYEVGDGVSVQNPVDPNTSVNIVIPNVPSGITLPSINNAWTLVKNFWTDDPEQDFLFLGSGSPEGTDPVYLIDGNDTLATYFDNGTFLEVTYDGQLYFGALDDTYPDFNPGDTEITPLRFVLTPLDFGDQIELIKPYVIEVGQSTKDGNIFTIKGRYFSLDDENDIIVEILDTNSELVPIPTNNSIEFINKITIKFELQDVLSPGSYHLILRNDDQFGAPLSNIYPFDI